MNRDYQHNQPLNGCLSEMHTRTRGTDPDVECYLNVCENAVRLAGAVLVDHFGQVSARKKGPSDLITEADLASQEVVRQTIQKAFPDHSLIGEEDPPDQSPPERQSDFRWIVDPLDGTTNYFHQVPFFSVSLALERCGEALVGAVYNPISGECFTAAAKHGAFLNGVALRTSDVRTMSEALIATGFPPAVTPDGPDLRLFNEIVLMSQSVRRTGSAALNLAYVAAGRFDAGWSFSTKIWDVAAGALLIQEAGGVVTSFSGGRRSPDMGEFLVAATPELHGEIRLLVRRLGLSR